MGHVTDLLLQPSLVTALMGRLHFRCSLKTAYISIFFPPVTISNGEQKAVCVPLLFIEVLLIYNFITLESFIRIPAWC